MKTLAKASPRASQSPIPRSIPVEVLEKQAIDRRVKKDQKKDAKKEAGTGGNNSAKLGAKEREAENKLVSAVDALSPGKKRIFPDLGGVSESQTARVNHLFSLPGDAPVESGEDNLLSPQPNAIKGADSGSVSTHRLPSIGAKSSQNELNMSGESRPRSSQKELMGESKTLKSLDTLLTKNISRTFVDHTRTFNQESRCARTVETEEPRIRMRLRSSDIGIRPKNTVSEVNYIPAMSNKRSKSKLSQSHNNSRAASTLPTDPEDPLEGLERLDCCLEQFAESGDSNGSGGAGAGAGRSSNWEDIDPAFFQDSNAIPHELHASTSKQQLYYPRPASPSPLIINMVANNKSVSPPDTNRTGSSAVPPRGVSTETQSTTAALNPAAVVSVPVNSVVSEADVAKVVDLARLRIASPVAKEATSMEASSVEVGTVVALNVKEPDSQADYETAVNLLSAAVEGVQFDQNSSGNTEQQAVDSKQPSKDGEESNGLEPLMLTCGSLIDEAVSSCLVAVAAACVSASANPATSSGDSLGPPLIESLPLLSVVAEQPQPVEVDPELLSRFRTMLRVGIPVPVIRTRMADEGFSDEVIEDLVGGGVHVHQPLMGRMMSLGIESVKSERSERSDESSSSRHPSPTKESGKGGGLFNTLSRGGSNALDSVSPTPRVAPMERRAISEALTPGTGSDMTNGSIMTPSRPQLSLADMLQSKRSALKHVKNSVVSTVEGVDRFGQLDEDEGNNTEAEGMMEAGPTRSGKERLATARRHLNMQEAGNIGYEEEYELKLKEKMAAWEELMALAASTNKQLDKTRLSLGQRLGRGRFAAVYSGYYKIPISEDNSGGTRSRSDSVGSATRGRSDSLNSQQNTTASGVPRMRSQGSFGMLGAAQGGRAPEKLVALKIAQFVGNMDLVVKEFATATGAAANTSMSSASTASLSASADDTPSKAKASKSVKIVVDNNNTAGGGGGGGISSISKALFAEDESNENNSKSKEASGSDVATSASSGSSTAAAPSEPRSLIAPTACSKEFARELRALAQLPSHPNVIRLEGIVLSPLCLVLEKMDMNLGDALEDPDWQFQHDTRSRLVLLDHIVSALAHLHKHLYLHRDLKPHNILLQAGPAGRSNTSSSSNLRMVCAKIADLGTAARLSDIRQQLSDPCGTSGYTAPEVLYPGQYGLPADVFSLGVLGWSLFSQRRQANPVAGLEPRAAAVKLMCGIRPEFGPEHPLLVQRIITRCWESEASSRVSAAEVHQLLQDVLSTPEKFQLVYDRPFSESSLKVVAPSVRRRSLEKVPSGSKMTSGKGTATAGTAAAAPAAAGASSGVEGVPPSSSKSIDPEPTAQLVRMVSARRGSFNGRPSLLS